MHSNSNDDFWALPDENHNKNSLKTVNRRESSLLIGDTPLKEGAK
jgi:hypothetical protein